MELIKVQDSRYTEYERLLLERDELRSQAGRIWTAYLQRFGKLETEVFEEKIECIRRKKMIAYMQKMKNYGLDIDPQAMQDHLDAEMQEYQEELAWILKHHRDAMGAKRTSAYEARRAKELYRKIAKLIHPDINPETDRNDVLIDLWNRTIAAYGCNDIKELSEVEVLARKALAELGLGAVRVDIPDIYEKIEALKEEIRAITSEKPYIYRLLVNDEEEAQKKINALKEELEEYIEYKAELEAMIEEILESGEVKIQWRMN